MRSTASCSPLAPDANIAAPTLTSVTTGPATTTAIGSVSGGAAPYTLELFTTPVCDGSGRGEGRTFLGRSSVATAGTYSVGVNAPTSVGDIVTATVTDANGNTSGFSLCRTATLPIPTVSVEDTAVVEGVMGQLRFVFSSPLVQATCWRVRHFDGSATRPADDVANAGQSCWPAGTAGPVVTGIQVVDDGVAEGPETFTVEIYDIVGATPGTTTATWTITDQQYALSVQRAGTGAGTVSSSPAGIDCGVTCSVSVDDGTAVTLTATADAGSVFAGWSGACTGTAACVVTVDARRRR